MLRRKLMLMAVPALLPGAAPLVGRWRSLTTTKGGIGAVYEFQANGSASYSSSAIVDMDYSIEGSQLKLGDQPASFGFHTDGRLQVNFGGGHFEDFKRQGKQIDAATPLFGEWSGTRIMDGRSLPVTFFFHPGGRAMLVIRLKTVAGRYQSAASGNNEWRMTLPSLPARKIVHDGVSGQLMITADGGDVHAFGRF